MVILVTGASGQLGQALRFVSGQYPDFDFHFAASSELDITRIDSIETVFANVKPDFCINTAAYTAVDKAESEREIAQLINVDAARNLAQVCRNHDTTLIHISTDFVFDGESEKPYKEEDVTHPQGVYGQTKLDGEKAIAEVWDKHVIIRTSWLYSQFGNNFMKTMLRLASERDSISVVNDQIGTPTNAVDLAEAIMGIIKKEIPNSKFQIPPEAKPKEAELNSYVGQPTTDNQPSADTLNPEPFTLHPYGIYHFSNEGQCSWYDFAKKIFEVNKIKIALHPIPTSAFPTAAKRPRYSVLDKSKIATVFGVVVRPWEEAIEDRFRGHSLDNL